MDIGPFYLREIKKKKKSVMKGGVGTRQINNSMQKELVYVWFIGDKNNLKCKHYLVMNMG